MKRAALSSIGFALLSMPALAHDANGVHGGRLVDAGDYHVELVTKGTDVDVYVLDHDNKPVPTAGYKAIAILSAVGKSVRIVLTPADASKLTGKSETALPSAPKGVVQITPPNGKTVQAKFN